MEVKAISPTQTKGRKDGEDSGAKIVLLAEVCGMVGGDSIGFALCEPVTIVEEGLFWLGAELMTVVGSEFTE
jgi:hypothetical protein